jgi:hypothetical protein
VSIRNQGKRFLCKERVVHEVTSKSYIFHIKDFGNGVREQMYGSLLLAKTLTELKSLKLAERVARFEISRIRPRVQSPTLPHPTPHIIIWQT